MRPTRGTALGTMAALAVTPFVVRPARADTALRVATTPIELGAQVFYAKELGLYKKAGLDVDVSVMASGGAIAPAVVSGSIDIAQGNVVSIATAHEKGLPFVVVGPTALYSSAHPTTALLVAKSSPMRTGKDLNGKTVAVNGLKNITEIGASAWIDKSGGDAKTARFVETPFPQMEPGLVAGRLDAAVVAEPDYSLALAHGLHELAACYDAIAKEFLIGAWFATSTWAKAHPEELKRFVGATIEAGKWANAHHAESAKILEKYTKIQVTTGMRRAVYADRLEAAQMQPLIDAAAKYGALKAPFRAADLVAPAA